MARVITLSDQTTYRRPFGSDDMPAQTCLDFEKDVSYLTMDFCNLALEIGELKHRGSHFANKLTGPFGYFSKGPQFFPRPPIVNHAFEEPILRGWVGTPTFDYMASTEVNIIDVTEEPRDRATARIMGDISPPKHEHLLVAVPYAVNDILDDLQKKFPHLKITVHSQQLVDRKAVSEPIPDSLWEDITILVTLFTLPPDPSLVPNLHLIHVLSAGVEQLASTPIWNESRIAFTNSSGVHAPQIAEWVILQILSHFHRQKLLLELQNKHTWGSDKVPKEQQEGVGQTFGVLGYGAIGRQAGRVAHALGFDVIAFTATPKKTPESKKDRGYIVPRTGDADGSIPSSWYSGLDKASLHEFLAQDIDVLLVSVPLTPETIHLLAKEEFRILGKKNAFIINVSRGKVLEQNDLIAALKMYSESGATGGVAVGAQGLRGAALDVTDPEPLPADSELWDLKNVVVTPHISARGSSNVQRSFQIVEQNINRISEGKRLLNEVNRSKGY